jgi:hypothetical protein
MSNIDHEAASVQAQKLVAASDWLIEQGWRPLGGAMVARAYLDLSAQVAEMGKYLADGTPLQSDDFTRGEEYGADCCSRLINDVIDGKTSGVMCGKIGEARQRLIDKLIELEQENAALRARKEELAEMLRRCVSAGQGVVE